MTEVGFYHLTRTPLDRALPKLLERVLASGMRAVVMTGSAERVAAIDAALWTYEQLSFLPHGSARDGEAEFQPIWLTTDDENPNGAQVLVLTDGAVSEHVGDYARCLDMFDGRDPEAVNAARGRWKQFKDAGHALAYWQQNEAGSWEKKET
jgi:DNA polymerase III subunit chi